MSESNPIIEALNFILSDAFMFFVWLIPFTLSLRQSIKYRDGLIALAAAISFPFLLYFTWAASELWKTHETATAFNRSSQFVSAFFLTLFILSLICGKHGSE